MDDFLIWAAGFFDGEGCVSITGSNIGQTPYYLIVSIANNCKSSLELFVKRSYGTITFRAPAGTPTATKYFTKADSYIFTFSRQGAKEFLTLALPYLRVKQAEAKLALDYINVVSSLASLRYKRRGYFERRTSIEREVCRNFYLNLKAIREGKCQSPIELPQLELHPKLFDIN